MTFVMNLLEVAAKARLGQGRGVRDAFANLRPGTEAKAT
jgi:hypothetical protein